MIPWDKYGEFEFKLDLVHNFACKTNYCQSDIPLLVRLPCIETPEDTA